MQRDIGMRAAEYRNGKAWGFTIGGGFQAPPYGKRIEHQNAPLHMQETFNNAFSGIGLAPALLGDNGDVRIKCGVGDRMGFLRGQGHSFPPAESWILL